MYGVTFGEKHSYRDWNLIPKSRPVISPPTPKTLYVDIPESDGKLDLSESLSGEIKFDNRMITFEFNVREARSRWTDLYSEILNYLHGRRMNIYLDEDPKYYYSGRVQVNEWKSDKKTSTLVITAEVDPYKYNILGSLDPWLWDTFNFETDVIREYADVSVDGSRTFTICGSRRSVVPLFIVNSTDHTGMQVVFQGKTFDLLDGTNRVPNIVIKDGESEVTLIGNGTVSIDYREGSL